MTGQEAVDYIHSARGRGKKDGLRKITELMHRLGDPQDRLRYVHVVGTNGKGSTTSMIAHSLTAAGYRTGMFISPFILDFRERMQIDGEMISPEALASCVEEVRREAERRAVSPPSLSWSAPLPLCGLPGSSARWWCWKPASADGWTPPTS